MNARLSWCWFGLALALSLAFVGASAHGRAVALDRLTAVSTGSAPAGGPAAGRHRIVPPTAFDSLYWISYAQRMAATGEWRVRETTIDNAPDGRAVHWSSGLAWWLVALGRGRQAFTGEPLPQAIEYAAAYANPALMAIILLVLGTAGARRHGPAVGGLLVVVVATSPQLLNSFAVNEPDHHGLINAAALGTVLGLFAGGLGWERRDHGEARGLLPGAGRARAWFIASAWCGAAGLWLSAASQILVLVGVGLGAVFALIVAGRGDAAGPVIVRPELWRTWGRWGAGAALGFHALEYFPSHLAMRLEVNHPLHAAAWWGAGELLAALAAWRQAGTPLWPHETRTQLTRGAAVLALAAPAGALAVGGAAWFRMFDPIFSVLPELVLEGQSFLENVKQAGAAAAWRDLSALGAIFLLGLSALAARGLGRTERALVAAVLVTTVPLLVAGWWQNRWLMLVAASSPVLAVTGALAWRAHLPHWRGALALGGLAMFLAGGFPWNYARLSREIATASVLTLSPSDEFVLAMRHYAQELRRTAGAAAAPIVLAGPNESALLAYYGGFRTVGTFYWENVDGLRAAAAIYATSDLNEAKRRFAERAVTYLLSCPPGNFAEGYAALASGVPDRARAQRSLAALLFAAERFPQWLRPLWLPPPGLIATPPAARCFQFAPEQTEAEQMQHIQRYGQEAGRHATRQP